MKNVKKGQGISALTISTVLDTYIRCNIDQSPVIYDNYPSIRHKHKKFIRRTPLHQCPLLQILVFTAPATDLCSLRWLVPHWDVYTIVLAIQMLLKVPVGPEMGWTLVAPPPWTL